MDLTLVFNPPIVKKISLSLKWRFNLRFFLLTTIILVGFLLGFYILQLKEMAETFWLIEKFTKEISQISQENQTLEIHFSQLNSLESREKLIKNLGFEPIEKIHFIRVPETEVVTK